MSEMPFSSCVSVLPGTAALTAARSVTLIRNCSDVYTEITAHICVKSQYLLETELNIVKDLQAEYGCQFKYGYRADKLDDN